MITRPKKFWPYILPFLAVVPLTLTFFTIATNLSAIRQEQELELLSLAMQKGLEADLADLVTQGDEIAALPSLQNHILANDYEAILASLLAERQHRNVGLMGLANTDGYIITRTLSAATLGEHAFTSSPQGRAITKGSDSVRSIEVSSFDRHEVLMTTGRWVMADQTKLGALFANHLLDDAYALAFASDHLEPIVPNAGIAFYTNEFGIYGSSSPRSAVRELIANYFTSELLTNDGQLHRLRLNNQEYRVKNIPIPGLEDTATGALLFLPIASASTQIILAFLASLTLALVTDLIIKKGR